MSATKSAVAPSLYQISTAEGFICGAIGACTAVTFTNPFEVCKTRMQLQGELEKTGQGKRVYNNVLDAFRKTWRFEGIRGLQRGLSAAYIYQVLLNGSRLGFYDPLRRQYNKLFGYSASQQVMPINIASGASSGVIGAIFGNPLYLVKARMQAFSPSNPVGAQHNYKSFIHALATIVRAEGPKGLARGVDAAMLRTAMGSSAQLPAYNFAKSQLVSRGILPDKSVWTYLASSTFSGCCVCALMQPADTALTRMYNQSPNSVGPDGKPRGLLYKNPIDCLWKTFQAEGIRGWYKGTTAHLLRIAPHTVLTLVVNEYVVQQYVAFKSRGISLEVK